MQHSAKSTCKKQQNKYKVYANEVTPQLMQGSVLAVGSMILLMMNSNKLISDGMTITAAQIGQLTTNLQEKLITADPAGQLINQANNLGTALKSGADMAAIKALSSGALIYSFLQSLQDVLFPSSTITSNFTLLAMNNTYELYITGRSPLTYDFYDIVNTDLIGIAQDNIREGYYPEQVQSQIYFECYRKSDRQLVSDRSARLYFRSEYGYFYTGNDLDLYKSIIFGTSSYSAGATSISSSESVNIPTVLPQSVINNITNYDGVSDLVLGIPEGYTVPIDNSITVNTGTIIDTPPIDVPVDPPVEPTLIGTVAAILAGLTPITGFLEYILAGQVSLTETIESGLTGVIDGIGDIAGTLTGGITSSLTDIQTSLLSLFDPPTETLDLDKLKNLNSVLFTKFPFSIPFDYIAIVTAINADPVAPVLSIPFNLQDFGGSNTNVEIDLSIYDNFANIARQIGFIGFVIFMLFNTRKLIWK